MSRSILNGQLFEWRNILPLIVAEIPTLKDTCNIADALLFFINTKSHKAVVLDSNTDQFIGVLDSIEVFKAVKDQTTETSLIKNFITQPQLTIYEGDSLNSALDSMLKQGIGEVIVLNKEKKFLGELFLSDLLNYIWRSNLEFSHFYREILELANNGVMVIDTEGTTIFYNKTAEEILGHQANQILGKPITTFLKNSKTYEVLKTGKPESFDRLKIGDKTLKTKFTPKILDDKITGAVAVFQDISELEAVTEKLNVTEKLKATLDAIIENSYEGIAVIDNEERVIIMNQFYLDLIGLSLNDVIGRPILEISPNSGLPNVLKTGLVQMGEPWKIGNQSYMVMRAPIKHNGKIIGAIGKILFKDMEVAKIFAKKVMRLEDDLKFYKEEIGKIRGSHDAFEDIVGESDQITIAKTLALRATRTSSTVLLLGESGTGKEVFARAIHRAGARKHAPFVSINCAAIPEHLLESELFGYVEGAFTGAPKCGKPGKFELANQGTIFLDEIGDMSLAMQAKLLRVIQEREIERVGGTRPIKVDVRLMAATNHDLYQMVTDQKFRLDLYYRLNVIAIELPALRERLNDLELLIAALIKRLNKRLETSIEGVMPDAMNVLMNYSWPGNVRELENVLERAINISEESLIRIDHLPSEVKKSQGSTNPAWDRKTLEQGLFIAEKKLIINALRETKGNKVQAARALGIHRSVLYKKLSRHNLLSFMIRSQIMSLYRNNVLQMRQIPKTSEVAGIIARF